MQSEIDDVPNTTENETKNVSQQKRMQSLIEYKDILCQYLNHICFTLIKYLKQGIIPLILSKIKAEEENDDIRKMKNDLAFYYKMCADYYRYICEYIQTEDRDLYLNETKEFYEKAIALVNDIQLKMNSGLRLALMLNLTVFYCDIYENYEKAIEISQETYDLAVKMDGDVVDDHWSNVDVCYQSMHVQRLLVENIRLWTIGLKEKKEKENAELKENCNESSKVVALPVMKYE